MLESTDPMGLDETHLGGRDLRFPETSWGLVTRLHSMGDDHFREGLEALCRLYWKPVYFFVRLHSSSSNDDAKDLTQAFFAYLMEGKQLRKYDKERGSFRCYLKVLLKRFLKDDRVARKALKRGGGTRILPLDGIAHEKLLEDGRQSDPNVEFDRIWALEVAKRAVEAVRERFLAEGREMQFRAYEEYELKSATERPTYSTVAKTLGLTETAVRNYLFAVRGEVRAMIRQELAKTVESGLDVDDELRTLFGS